ncbi:MAG: alpha-E domain-containing protein [Bacteroidota bacterium]
MISRVADHCFWVGRYLDRAESTARLLQATRNLAFDAELPTLECWRPLVTVSGQYPDFLERFGAEAAGNGEVVQRYLTWAAENPVSVRNSVRGARESARSVREVLSSDIWQSTNQLFLWFTGDEAARQYEQDRDEVYRHVRASTQLCLGLVRSTMLHDAPMDFLWLGVLLERVGQTARILDMHHHMLAGTTEGQHQILQTALWLSLLRACSGFEAFMRRHQGRVTRKSVVSFLLLEPAFPRSLRYCARSALEVMRRIWPERDGQVAAGAIARMVELDRWLGEHEEDSLPTNIHGLLTRVVEDISMVCGEVQQGLEGAPEESATQQQSQ